jgi:hypothetical protein
MQYILRSIIATASLIFTSLGGAAPGISQTSEAEFRCDSSPKGSCHFVLYKATCQEGPVVNARPSMICTNEYLQEMTVETGKPQKVKNLPFGWKQCPVKPGIKSSFPACAL